MLKFFKNRFFKTTFIIYVLLFGILISVFCFLFFHQQKRIKEERLQMERQAQAKIMLQIMDEKFSMIDQITTQISASSWRPYVASKSDILYSNVDYFKKNEVCQQIETMQTLLSVSESMAVLFPQKGLAIDSSSFWEIERYFRFLDFSEGYSWQDTMEEVLSADNKAMNLFVIKGSSSGDFIVIKQLEKENVSQGMLFVLVDSRYFEKFIHTNLPEAVGLSIRLDGTDVYRYQEADPDASVMEVSLQSNLYTWEYVFTLDMGTGENEFWNTYYMAIGYLGCILMIILLSYFLARLTYLPIVRVLKKIDWIKETEYYGLERFEQIYFELQTEKENFEELGNQYYQIGKNSFIQSLLMGSYDKEHVSEYMKKFHMNISADMSYQVTIFMVPDQGGQDILLDKILKFQIECFQNGITAITCDIEDRYVMILGREAGDAVLLEQRERLNTFLDEQLSDIDLELYTGNIYTGFTGIHLSYKEALRKYLQGDNQKDSMVYYYLYNKEVQMVNHMRSGDFDEAQAILNSMISEKKNENVSKELNTLGDSIVKYVDEHYTYSGLSQQDIAEYFRVSRPTVSKAFKEAMNMNFVDYLHMKRVKYAKILIAQGNYDVLKVARESGFEKEVTFKRAFVKNENMTPRAYIKQKKLMV